MSDVLPRSGAVRVAAVVGVVLAWGPLVPATEAEALTTQAFRFDFGTGKVAPGFTPVAPHTRYTKALGFGPGIRGVDPPPPNPS